MRIPSLIVIPWLLTLTACSSGLTLLDAGDARPYVNGMHGVENLAFDGQGALFVTGLDGMIYRIAPTADPFQGKISARRKIGVLCTGIEVGPDGYLYVGVKDPTGLRRIAKIDKELAAIAFLTDDIPGLNGFAQSRGWLYYTSSDEKLFRPRGRILRVRFGLDENFQHPETVVDKAGLVNGLAFSPDEAVLYYTETLHGVWAFDLATGMRRQLFYPHGLQVFDDLTSAPDGTLWVCLNSQLAVVPLRNGIPGIGYHVGDLKAPSACAFGKGPGFRPDFLYLTEFGLKGRSLTMNGRGVWVLPTAGRMP